MSFIRVRHNIEVAHRLINLKGDCENIHGHSMLVDLTIYGHIDKNGVLEGLDFGSVKKLFREHLDTTYDHRLLLNEEDPWTQMFQPLPGLIVVPGDPTTENIARWIAMWATKTFHKTVDVLVQETHVNFAGVSAKSNGE